MDVFEAIRERRSVRAFISKPVPKALLTKVLEAAKWAPSAGNCQPWDFIIVKDARVKRKLCEAALDQEFIEQAPVDIVVCANEERSAIRYGDRGRKLYCLLDAAAAVQNLLLAVHALGLGACWVGAYDDRHVIEILSLPSWLKPIAIIPIGYPGEKPRPTERIPLDALIHEEHYRGFKMGS